jgi:glycosyltransferase involved in cell wall biosynthesis
MKMTAEHSAKSTSRPKRKRVLHVTQAAGGVHSSLRLLLLNLDQSKYDINLACPPDYPSIDELRRRGITVHLVQMVRDVKPVHDIRACFQLIRLLKGGLFDVIHAHSAKAGFLVRLASRFVPGSIVFYAPRAFSYLSQVGWKRRFFLALERLARHWCRNLIACSQSEADRAVGEVGYRRSQVVVIPNSVDPFLLASSLPSLAASKTTLAWIGRLVYQKNPMMFLDLAEILLKRRPDFKFLMKGAGFMGYLESEVQKRIERTDVLRESVQLLRWDSIESAYDLYGRSNVFVLTSHFEGMPNTVLEAMAFGRPVVATRVDGTQDVVVDGETGCLVEDGDVAGMADAILRITSNPSLQRLMGEAGRRRIVDYHQISRNIVRLEQLYDEGS